MKKLLHLIQATNGIGGAELLSKDLTLNLLALGYPVKTTFLKRIKGRGIEIPGKISYLSRFFKLGIFFCLINILINAVRRKAADEINLGVTEGWPHFLAVLSAKINRSSSILWVQADIRYIAETYWGWPEKQLFKWALRSATHIVCISPITRESLLEFCAPNKDRISLINNCVRPEFFSPREDVTREIDVLYVGRIEPIKNLDLLLKALAIEKQARAINVVIAGNGTDMGKIKRNSEELDPKNVNINFLGEIDNVAQVMRKSKCLVLTSFAEGFGLVIPEAIISGCEVIITPFRGSEYLKEEFPSLSILDEYSAVLLSDAIKKSLSCWTKRVPFKIGEANKWRQEAWIKKWLDVIEANSNANNTYQC